MNDQKPAFSCAYCSSNHPGTNEHVIPRRWFPEDDPVKVPIIIKACHACNNEKSKNDEWLRKWFSSLASDQSPEAMKVLYGPVARSIKRQPVLGKEMINRMTLVDVFDIETHLHLGEKTRVVVNAGDWDRILSWINQVVRGLYAWDKKEVLPCSYEVQTFFACDELFQPKDFIKKVLSYIPFPQAWHIKDAKVFMFGRAYVPEEPRTSIWITSFYNRAMFISFVGKREWIKEQHKLWNEAGRIKKEPTKKYVFKPAE